MKEAYYFPHDVNAIQDPKMMALLTECGVAGIGLFWIIIEILHQQDSGAIAMPLLRHYINFYGKQGTWDEHTLTSFERVVLGTKLLISDGENVTSLRVKNNKQRRIEISNERSESGKKGADARWQNHGYAMANDGKRMAKGWQTMAKEKKVKEKKRKEIKEKTTAIAAAPQTNQPLTDVQKVVTVFKMAQGYPKDDKAWNALNFARCSKTAKALLAFFGNWEDAADCIQDVYERLTSKGLTVTLETISKHAADWKKDKREKEAGHGILSMPGNGSLQAQSG